MKNLLKSTLLTFAFLISSSALAVGPGGGATGVYAASVTILGNDGSGSYYYTFSVSGNTLSQCETALDDAIASHANVWGWTYCKLQSIDTYFELDIFTPGGLGDVNGGSGNNGTVITEIAHKSEELASQYDLGGYQIELDRLNARYRINEYKSELMDIYRQATRQSTGR